MIQVNNGFADYYYLREDGMIYDAAADKLIKPSSNHIFTLKTTDNGKKKIALKTLYKYVYNKTFCNDQIIDLDNEQWKEIDDTEGLYYVSNMGRIKSMQGYEAIILKPYNNQGGYARVDIIESGKRQSKLVHRCVAAAFLPLPEKIDMQLHHNDFNKNNNAADNLIWLSPAAHTKIHVEQRSKDTDAST